MKANFLTQLRVRFAAYVSGFAGTDGTLHPMQELKRVHSCHVAADARRIAKLMAWEADACDLADVCGLLHDVGRFSQFAEFGTFEDRRSVNHAWRGHEILQTGSILDGLDGAETATVLAATRVHSALALPSELDARVAPFAWLVRDADKLDILRVFAEALRSGDIDRHGEISLNVDWTREPRPEMCARVGRGEPISYADIRTLGDFLLVLLGWRHAIHFPQTLHVAMQRRLFAELAGYLPATDNVRACLAALEIEAWNGKSIRSRAVPPAVPAGGRRGARST